MLYFDWPFSERRQFLKGWNEVLKEEINDKLLLILKEIAYQGTISKSPAYTEVAQGLIEHFDEVASLREKILKGWELTEIALARALGDDNYD